MKILLVDADSSIPNIPLMKLASYHRQQGDSVELLRLGISYYPRKNKKTHTLPTGFDKTYCSVIFKGSRDLIKGDAVFGGTGVDLKTTLPDVVEDYDPDYSIYPDNDTSYGFLSRGCIRKCSFCVVPEKEGPIRKVSDISKILRHKKVNFLDNNILALPECAEILTELADRKIKVYFNSGLDIRLVTDCTSLLLSRLNYLGDYLFSFDSLAYLPLVSAGLSRMSWRKDWQIKFNIYTHPDMAFHETTQRVLWCSKNKTLPYIMRDITCWDSPFSDFYVDLAAWCNQPNLFKKIDFKTFLQKRHPTNSQRAVKSFECWKSGL